MGKEESATSLDILSDEEKNQALRDFFVGVPRTSLKRDYYGADTDTILDAIGERKQALDQSQTIPSLGKLLSLSHISPSGTRYMLSDYELSYINGVHDDVPGYSPELERKFELYRVNEGKGIFSALDAATIEIDLYNSVIRRVNAMYEAVQNTDVKQWIHDAVTQKEKEDFYVEISKALMPEEERELVERRAKYEAYYVKLSNKMINITHFLPAWQKDMEVTHGNKVSFIP
jgi:hypothetical protein